MIKIFPAAAGGTIRPAVFCKALASMGYDVEIYAFTARKEDYKALKRSYNHSPFEGITEYVSTSFFHFFINQIFKFIKAPPIWPLFLTSLGYCPKELKTKLAEADFVISEFVFTMKANKNLCKSPWFLDSHNLEYIRESKQGGIHKFYGKIVKYFEQKVSRSYDGVLACTEEETKFFAENKKENFQNILVPNGVDSNMYLNRTNAPIDFDKDPDANIFLFFGSGYYANEEAAQFLRKFAKENDSFLKENKIYFVVAGSVYKKAFKEGNFIATSYVDDPIEYYTNADFLINPMILGSGSNIKIAEAISAELPIISSKFGMRGFTARENIDYIAFERANLKTILCQAVTMDKNEAKKGLQHIEKEYFMRLMAN